MAIWDQRDPKRAQAAGWREGIGFLRYRILDGAEWRKLIDGIPTETVRDLRDRARIATITYSFAPSRCGPRAAKASDCRWTGLTESGRARPVRWHPRSGSCRGLYRRSRHGRLAS